MAAKACTVVASVALAAAISLAFVPTANASASLPRLGQGERAFASPLALAQDLLLQERRDNFAGVAASRLTTAQASQVVLGPVDYPYSLDLTRLATSSSIFAVGVEGERSYASVDFLLGDRTIAMLSCELTDKGWRCASLGSEAPRYDNVRRQVSPRLTRALGGSPEESCSVGVFGSIWIIARRDTTEAAAFIDYYSYGCEMGGPKPPRLPPEGTVLDVPQFKSLVATLQEYRLTQTAQSGVWPRGRGPRFRYILVVVAAMGALAGWLLGRRMQRRPGGRVQ